MAPATPDAQPPSQGPSTGLLVGIGVLAAAGLGALLVVQARRRSAGAPAGAGADDHAEGRATTPGRTRDARDTAADYQADEPAASALHRRPSAPPATPPLVRFLGDERPPPSAVVAPEPGLELLVGKAYLDVGDSEEARKWLRLVAEHGDEAQRQEAAELLK